ncbi:MAG: class I SAM-dependent methyltransferase [Candidatus Aminicenantes bacterium]|nr:MAG: class I SAM-dependent methyltransferase [Candidatus Aminicenantes bacterium]
MKKRILHGFMFFVVGLLVTYSISLAQGKSDEELKKMYAPVLGEYAFEWEGLTLTLNFYVKAGALWGDSGDGRPMTLKPAVENTFEFTAEDAKNGTYELKFLKDDQGKYSVCHVINSGIGLDIKGTKNGALKKSFRQTVTVEDFSAEGFILDIGGGGEGVIGQLKGQQVIAIDISKRELEEAPPGPLKIVMDARDLKFLDNTFNTATVFYTFMYIASSDHQKVFEELQRVLTPGGRLLIWDVIFPERTDKTKNTALFLFTFKLPDREIGTGYGVRRPEGEQGLAHFIELAKKTGFKIVSYKEKDQSFFLEVEKPKK